MFQKDIKRISVGSISSLIQCQGDVGPLVEFFFNICSFICFEEDGCSNADFVSVFTGLEYMQALCCILQIVNLF
jgi:hypothetical protein